MGGWQQFFLLIVAGLVMWFLYRGIRGNPEAFSKANLSKSFGTMGILGVGLIVFIGLCVLLLRN